MPDEGQNISWPWILEALPNAELNKVPFWSLFSNASCCSYNMLLFTDLPQDLYVCFAQVHLIELTVCTFLQEIYELTNTLATPMQSQCNRVCVYYWNEINFYKIVEFLSDINAASNTCWVQEVVSTSTSSLNFIADVQ